MSDIETEKIDGEDEINLLQLLVVILKWKKMILGFTLASALVVAVISLFMTPIYRAETNILPPQQSSSGMSQLMSGLGGAAGFLGGSLGIKNPNDVYIAILKSRAVLDRIIDRFELMKLFEAESREAVRRSLSYSVDATSGKNGLISVAIENKDPELAALMANAFIDELKNLTQHLAVTEASKRRLFFEEQLRIAKENLMKSEEAMQSFQEETGAIKMDAQASAVISSIAGLRAQIANREVQLKVMKTYTKAKNPDLQMAEDELQGLNEQLEKLEANSENKSNSSFSTGKIPKLGTDYFRKLRDLKYRETLFNLMLKQYEMARVEESRDAISIQVLDKAIVPERRIKPNRKMMVIMALIVSFFLAVFAVFLIEFLMNLSGQPKNKEIIEDIKRYAAFRKR